MTNMTPSERFFRMVEKLPSGCWQWTGSVTNAGYGRFWLNGKNTASHYFLVADRKPTGKFVLHRCDNRLCVNPDHLFFGTQKDNLDDMFAKGRANQRPGWLAMMKIRRIKTGSSNHKSKLSESNVKEILNAPKRFGYMAELAKKFGVSHQAIRKVVRGESWSSAIAELER